MEHCETQALCFVPPSKSPKTEFISCGLAQDSDNGKKFVLPQVPPNDFEFFAVIIEPRNY